jgi:predicted dehydrogenase
MQRKNFIKQTSILTSGLIFSKAFSPLILPSESPIFDGRKINIGIIGCGNRGTGIINILNGMSNYFGIKVLCDVLDFRMSEANKLVSSASVKETKDYHSLLEDKTVDAVIIATPLNLHFPMAVDALKAGKHVYLEKTMTYTIDEVIQLVKISHQYSSQVLQIGHQLPYTPLYRRVKEMINNGYLGKITQIECHYDRNGSWRRPVPIPSLERNINWRMYKAYSGGLTAEILAHQIEFINWAFNTHPDELFSTGGIDFYKDGRETYDNVQVTLRYNKAEMIGNFGATCSNSRDGFIFKLKGSKGTVELLMDNGIYYPEPEMKKELATVDGVTGATKIEWKKDGGISIIKQPMKDPTTYAFEDFYNCIIKNQRPVTDVIAGGTSAICVHLSNESLYTKTMQHWKPAYDLSKIKHS